MAKHFSFSRALADGIAATVSGLLALLGPRRGLKIRAFLPAALTPVGTVPGSSGIRLAIVDRRCLYWLHQGLASEPETLAWIEAMAPGETLYDIGANIGLFSMYAARRRTVNCIAVEPNPFSFSALCRNLLLNDLGDRITPLCLALGPQRGVARLGMDSVEAGAVGSTLAGADDTRRSLGTLLLALDDLPGFAGLPAPQHVKIDVDGIERLIVEGGTQLWAGAGLRSVLIETMHCTPQDRSRIDAVLAAAGLHAVAAESSPANTVYRRAAAPAGA
jgi:FkbM family methyltransferase